MIFFLLLLPLLAGICLLKLIHRYNFSATVKKLFLDFAHHAGRKYDVRQLAGLPEPVQKYFRHVLKDGQPYINTARLLHGGYFRTGQKKNWVKISGEQYFTTRRPGFIWKGKTSLFTAVDQYAGGMGRLQVFLMGIMRVVNGHGPAYDQGELLRWISESVWFPTNLLPSEHLQWLPIDATRAQLVFTAGYVEAFLIVTFSKKGEIIQMETQRYMGEGNLQSWLVKVANYREINEVCIPTKAEAIWRLATGDFSYARFHVLTLQYENGREFSNRDNQRITITHRNPKMADREKEMKQQIY